MEDQSYIRYEITLPESRKAALQEFLDKNDGKIIRENSINLEERNDSASDVEDIGDGNEGPGQLEITSQECQAQVTKGTVGS